MRKWKCRKILSHTGVFKTDTNSTTESKPQDSRPLQDAELVVDEESRFVTKAIAALPHKYRAPIVLRDIEGLSYEEVASVMGLGLGTTKSRISRARTMLREKLKEHFNG